VWKAHLASGEVREGEIVKLGFEWNHSPLAGERSSAGYVGLKNLGCTCYMNSLLQQFFMMPDFRKGILSIDFPSSTFLSFFLLSRFCLPLCLGYDARSLGYDLAPVFNAKNKTVEEEEEGAEEDEEPKFDDDVVEDIDDEEVVMKLFPKKEKKKKPAVIGSDDLLIEIQIMFAFLQESLRQFYNPKGFCFANKVRFLCFFLPLVPTTDTFR